MKHETNNAEFLQSFAEYGDAIFRFCLVKVSNKEQAEDMTQEVFMRYWQYLRDDKEMTNTRSFLYTIANNLAKDWYRKKKSDSLDAQIEAGQEPVANETNAQTKAEYNEILVLIEDVPEPDRWILLLRHVEGLPPREIAQVLGETANNVSVRLNRAEARLKQTVQHGTW